VNLVIAAAALLRLLPRIRCIDTAAFSSLTSPAADLVKPWTREDRIVYCANRNQDDRALPPEPGDVPAIKGLGSQIIEHSLGFPQPTQPAEGVFVMASLSAAAHTMADIKAKGQLQEDTAHRMWYFLAGVIGLCTLVNWTSKTIAYFSSSRTRGPAGDIEGRDAVTGKTSPRHIPSALAASARSLAFRYRLPTIFGNAILFSELGFILVYMAVTFTLLLIKSTFRLLISPTVLH
jgi:hypothetical protein